MKTLRKDFSVKKCKFFIIFEMNYMFYFLKLSPSVMSLISAFYRIISNLLFSKLSVLIDEEKNSSLSCFLTITVFYKEYSLKQT